MLVFARDQYLFTKTPLPKRLESDDDSLLCWLGLVEVATRAYAVHFAKAQENAARFFQPFREIGRRRIKASQHELSMQQGHGEDWIGQHGEQGITSKPDHSQREMEQIASELSLLAQLRYGRQRQTMPPLDGLSDTFLSKEFAPAEEAPTDIIESKTESVVSPGPFHIVPIVEQDISSDSSYQTSRRRRRLHISAIG